MMIHIAGMPMLEAEGYAGILQQWTDRELGAQEPIVAVETPGAADCTGEGSSWSLQIGMALASKLAPRARLAKPGWYAGLLLPAVTLPESEKEMEPHGE